MDPISAITGAISLIGIGTSLFGTAKNTGLYNQENTDQKQILGYQEQENQVQQEYANYTNQRQQLENLRNGQRSAAAGVATAAAQGAYSAGVGGSGVYGGQGDIAGNVGWANDALNVKYGFGSQISGLQNNISNTQMDLSNINSQINTNQGITNAGNAITKAAGPLGSILGSGKGISNSLFGGFGPQNNGGYSGMGGWQ